MAYPVPVLDINVSATFQSLSGPQLSANYPLTNAIVAPSLGRPFTNVPPTVDLLPNGTSYGDRVFQTDLRFSRVFRTGGTTVRPTVSIYNLFNANPVMQENAAYAVWRTPQRIMDARLFKVSGQLDF